MEEALGCCGRALRIAPRHADALYNCGNTLALLGRWDEAVQRYQQALTVAPQRAEIHNNLGNALLALRRIDEAMRSYQAAIRLKPDYAEARYNLGAALAQQDRMDEAAASLGAAFRLRPEKLLWQLRAELLWPPVFQSNQQIDEYRRRLADTLDRFRRLELRLPWPEIAACGCIPPFNMAHQGRPDRELRSQFAELFQPSFAEFNQRARETLGKRNRKSSTHRQSERKHIGIVVTRGHEPIFLRCMSGILNRLTPSRFQVTVFCAAKSLPTLQHRIQHPDVRFAVLPEAFPPAVATLQQAECDLLYYWEVSSDALNYFLPFLRLAPVQYTSWGTLVTTGVSEVNYYLSSELVEAADADRHYTEKLIRFHSLLSCHGRIAAPDAPRSRSRFGLPDGKHLYVCLQNLLKIHPDFDPMLAEILRRDPRGVIVLKENKFATAGRLLRERFRRTMPDVMERVVMLPWQDYDNYLRVLALSDVVLDPLHYGAGSTTYEIFSFNLPIVTLPGVLNVGRYTQACYRKMGLEEPIAADAHDYVDLAVRLGTDSDYRNAMRQRIAAASDVLFDDCDIVTEYERFFDRAVAGECL
jgi:predicted O-linked N-acetylglucosamine transferase (SPINDLY family)